ncbi:MAG: hypothetical protein U0136_15525 [Bdellovibrionota bacterium]
MVKKISGSTPSRPTGAASGVKGKQEIQSAQIDSVKKVDSVQGQGRTEQVRRHTRPMTADERSHLIQLVDEEADKLFGAGKLPESKRETLTRGVKLTIAAGIIDIDEEKK